jgi:hypothetical protein
MNSESPTIDLNPAGPGGEFTIQGIADGFLVKLDDANGNYLNAWQVGGPGYAGIPRPAGLVNGMLYVAGSFDQTANFPTGGTLTSNGSRDLYLMAFDDPAAVPQAISAAIVGTQGETRPVATEDKHARRSASLSAREQVFATLALECHNIISKRAEAAAPANKPVDEPFAHWTTDHSVTLDAALDAAFAEVL